MATQVANVSSKNKTVALILCIFLGCWGIHRFYVGKIGTGILYLFTAGLFGVGWIVDIIFIASGTFKDSSGAYIHAKIKSTQANYAPRATSVVNEPVTILSSIPDKENETKTLHIPNDIGDCTLAYKYEDVDVAGVTYSKPDYNLIHLGDKVEFLLEPDNQYDKNAIKIICNNIFIGHVHKGRLQDMISKWESNGKPIFSAITFIDKDKSIIKIFLAFYKNPLDGIERLENINASLIKTSKKDILDTSRQEYLGTTNEDDILTLEYNDEDEDYVVSDSYGNELGELSKSVSDKLKNKEIEFDFIPVVKEITENDSGKYGANITIYFKPKH